MNNYAVTINDLMHILDHVSVKIILLVFILPPLLALIITNLHRPGNGNNAPWKFIYSFLVYLICIPGMCACLLSAYTLLILKQNLLDVNIFAYFGPILSMTATLIIIGRQVNLDRLPGIERIYATMIFLVISFGVVLAILKTRIWIMFGGSVTTLIVITLVCFVLLKWSAHLIFKSKDKRKVLNSV